MALLAIGLMAAGCGGPITGGELGRGVKSVGALASEGVLLADGAARDRSRFTFTRVQARTLGEQADHEAEKLSDATASPALARPKAEAVTLAQDVSNALGELQVAPGDEARARAARATLRRLSDHADRLAGRL